MDTEQLHKKLLAVLGIMGALAQIKPLATPSVLRIKDADGKRALHCALEHHNDPKVIKQLINRNPVKLVSGVVDFFRNLPAESSFSNYGEVFTLL